MRIVHISDCYTPRLGGIETLVRELATAQHASGHEVTVLTATPDRDGVAGARWPDPFEVVRVTSPLPRRFPAAAFAFRRLRAQLGALRPDVVHVHAGVISVFAWPGIEAALCLGIPVLVTWHSTVPMRVAGVAARLGWVRRWQERGAELTAVSGLAAGRVELCGAKSVGVLPNAIDLSAWIGASEGDDVAAPPPGASAGERVVTVVSAVRIVKAKRPEVMAAAFLEAARRVPGARARFILCGDGPELGALRARLARHDERGLIELRGRVDRSDLAALYRDCDVYLTARLDEAFGLSPLEARAAGLPVVGRAGTGMDDFITHGEHGLLAGSDAELADHLAALLARPELLDRLKRNNRQSPIPYSQDEALRWVMDAYGRAVARRRNLRWA